MKDLEFDVPASPLWRSADPKRAQKQPGENPEFSHGEGLVWDPDANILLGVNRDENQFWWAEFPGGEMPSSGSWPELHRFEMPDVVNSVGLTSNVRKVWVALRKQIFLVDIVDPGPLAERTKYPLCPPVEGALDTRFNDGATLDRDSILIGTMHTKCEDPIGGLYLIQGGKSPKKVIDDRTVSNGWVMLEDGKTLLYVDSPQGLFQYTWDPQAQTATLVEHLDPLNVESLAGIVSPQLDRLGFVVGDGMTWAKVGDRELVLVSIFDGGATLAYDPAAKQVIGAIRCPAPLTTIPAIVGKNLDRVATISSREGLQDDELGNDSGNGFLADLSSFGIRGRREPRLDLSTFPGLPT